ncbi:MAG: PLP-dependent aminotransferase family protein [Gemmatirosa sp.]|nr:PLP-dependent aminotransferase family protein [Gemmatirosa sp.]
MPRVRAPETLPMQLTLDPHGAPRHQQIYAAFRVAILRGTLRRGDRLPSTRVLARDLGVSRTTVLGAFARLLAEGYVVGKAGGGTRVATTLPRQPHGDPAPPPAAPPSLSPAARALIGEGKWRRVPMEAVPFAAGLPAPDLFPLATWTRLAARRWRLSGHALLMPCDPRGHGPLREAIARYAVAARGVACTAEQVLVVNGAQHAVDLCARLLVGPDDAVWMESPGYLPARGMFAATGARLVDVPVDADGIDVAQGRLMAPDARLAFVTPSYQALLGVTMSLARRLALLEWARDAGAWIVEDDYHGEYRYDSAPVPAMQGLDAHGRVLYIGTFSKTLSSAIRLGYLIVPEALVEPFARARLLLDRHSPMPEQAFLADFIAGGHFARHIRRTRAAYHERQRAFLALAERELAGLVTFEAIPAGIRLLGWLPPDVSDRAVAAEAARRGVVVEPLSPQLGSAVQPPGLMFGYVTYGAAETRAAMRTLAAVIRDVQATPASSAAVTPSAAPRSGPPARRGARG